MAHNSLVPELSVADLKRSLVFYQNILGFKVDYERPEDRFVFMSFYGSELMLEQDTEKPSPWNILPFDYPRGRGLNLQIACPNAEELIGNLRQAGIPLQKPAEDCWYRGNEVLHGQRNFLVQDPDGYLLRFAQSLGTKPVSQKSSGGF